MGLLSLVSNVSAFGTYQQVRKTSDAMNTSLERLSSGYRINRASDDASGLTISESLRAQVHGLGQAMRNAQDGVSVVQIAEGALGQSAAILQRMRDLAVQAANDGVTDGAPKAAIQDEMAHLRDALNGIASTTNFNGARLLDGSYSGTFQVGANVGETLHVSIASPGIGLDAAGLGIAGVDVTRSAAGPTATTTGAVAALPGPAAAGRLDLAGDFTSAGTYPASFTGLSGTVTYHGATFDLGSVQYTGAVTASDYLNDLNAAAQTTLGTSAPPFTASGTALTFTGDVPGAGTTTADAASLTPSYAPPTGASVAITALDKAITKVTSTRADLGAVQNRFERTADRLSHALEDTQASESRIRDVDMAAQMTSYTRDQVLTQAGSAMLSATTHAPEALLKLLT
jgi:flagellin-like hook-associated protein FlgL